MLIKGIGEKGSLLAATAIKGEYLFGFDLKRQHKLFINYFGSD